MLGSLLALVVDVWMLAGGHASLTRDLGLLDGFYDVQGRALLAGHLAVDPARVGIEGFLVHGHTYMYFGPVPALLRLPVLMVTHSLDGRLTQLSMLLAFVVLLVAAGRLHWVVRRLVRPAAAVGRGEPTAAFMMQLALGAGAVPLFLASWPVVYQEAELWGAALAVGAIAAVVSVVLRPSIGTIAAAGALATLAVNTRLSVGLGPTLALAVLATGVAARRTTAVLERRGWRRAPRAIRPFARLAPLAEVGAGGLALLAVGALLAIGSSVAVNEAKFGTPFGLPFTKQAFTRVDPGRRAVLAANHNSLFGVKFAPTVLVQALRPDAIGTERAFPFVGVPHDPPTVIGTARFNIIEQSLSAPTSMPLFVLLLLAGLPAVVRRKRLQPLTGVLASTAAAFVPAMVLAAVATRYLADLVPFLLLGSVVGLHSLFSALDARPDDRRRRPRGWLLGAMAFFTLAGILINGAVGLEQQRLVRPGGSEADRAAFVRTQDDIDRFLGRRPHGIGAGPTLPARATGAPGDLFVLDRCAGLYVVGLEHVWLPAERTERSGVHALRVAFPRSLGSAPQALLSIGSGPGRLVFAAQARPGGVGFSVMVGDRTVAAGGATVVQRSAPVRVLVSFDPAFAGHYSASLSVGGRLAVTALTVPYDRLAQVALGADPGDPRVRRFAGTIAPVALRAPVCREVARRAGLRL